MQIFVRKNGKLSAMEIDKNMTFGALKNVLGNEYRYNMSCGSETLVSSVFSELSIINLSLPVLGGAKDISVEDKALAFDHISKITICRKCYRNNAKNATRCRNKRCGHTTNLRPKKMMAKKG